MSLFVSGCTHGCKGCFNKEAWDFNYGEPFTQKEIDYIIDYVSGSYISGLTILGGEPLEHVNQQGLLPLLRQLREKCPDKSIWCFTGYDFEKDVVGRMFDAVFYLLPIGTARRYFSLSPVIKPCLDIHIT